MQHVVHHDVAPSAPHTPYEVHLQSIAHVFARPNTIVRRLRNSSIGNDLLQVSFPEDFCPLRCAPEEALVILAPSWSHWRRDQRHEGSEGVPHGPA
jgi:hypothetical protein